MNRLRQKPSNELISLRVVPTIQRMKRVTKDGFVKFRITMPDKELFQACAQIEGLTLSSWLIVTGKAQAKKMNVTVKNIDHPNQIIMPVIE